MSCFACITGHLDGDAQEQRLFEYAKPSQNVAVTATLGFHNEELDGCTTKGIYIPMRTVSASEVHVARDVPDISAHRKLGDKDVVHGELVRPVPLQSRRQKRASQQISPANSDSTTDTQLQISPSLVTVPLLPAKGKHGEEEHADSHPSTPQQVRRSSTPRSPDTPKVMMLTEDGLVETSTKQLDLCCMDIPIEFTTSPQEAFVATMDDSDPMLSAKLDHVSHLHHPVASLAAASELARTESSEEGSSAGLGVSAVTERSTESVDRLPSDYLSASHGWKVQLNGDQLHRLSQATTISHGSGNGAQKLKQPKAEDKSGDGAGVRQTQEVEKESVRREGQSTEKSTDSAPTEREEQPEQSSAPTGRSLISRIAADLLLLDKFDEPSPKFGPSDSNLYKQLLGDPVQNSQGHWGLWC